MIYVTLNSRNVIRVLIRIAAASLLAMLFCIWALSQQSAGQNSASSTDTSTSDSAAAHSIGTAASQSDTELPAQKLSGNLATEQLTAAPAAAALYPFTISTNITLPVKRAYISSPFGYRDHPINGERSFHNGLDLAAPEGTDIYAVLDGTVVTAQLASDYGNYIIIDHGSFQSLYAHCMTLCASEGDIVTAGQKIAEVGSTGRATGSHLHLEFRCNDQRYDPAIALGDGYS